MGKRISATGAAERQTTLRGDRHQQLLTALETKAAAVASSLGLELVELSLRGTSKRRLVRVDIDRPGPRGVDIDDCQRVSGALGEALENDEAIDGPYVLEVSSPGVDRPILTADDFRRNVGRRVEVVTREAIEGRTRFVGVLIDIDERCIRIEDEDSGPVRVTLDHIESTRQQVGF